jgi:osmotically inducible protein OsmC
MNRLDIVRYTAKIHTTTGRESGASPTSNGRLDIRMSTPSAPGTGTNPRAVVCRQLVGLLSYQR